MNRLSVTQGQELAQRLADEDDTCYLICDRRKNGQGYVVVDARKASGEDLADSVDYAYPRYGGP